VADPNRALFESVVHLLVPLLDELVFVGGCMTGIFITDPAAGGIRPTRDVDAIVDVTSYAEYTALAERLRDLGLREDTILDHRRPLAPQEARDPRNCTPNRRVSVRQTRSDRTSPMAVPLGP
jgi:hypothetical protein